LAGSFILWALATKAWRGFPSTDLPVGLFRGSPVQPLPQKFFAFLPTQITCVFTAIPALWGVSPSSRTLGRDAMDAAASGALWRAANDADADGEVVWSLCPALFFATLRMQEATARQALLTIHWTKKKARRKWAGR
jgi:hypothetical protein